jgi:hypothetical protein
VFLKLAMSAFLDAFGSLPTSSRHGKTDVPDLRRRGSLLRKVTVVEQGCASFRVFVLPWPQSGKIAPSAANKREQTIASAPGWEAPKKRN